MGQLVACSLMIGRVRGNAPVALLSMKCCCHAWLVSTQVADAVMMEDSLTMSDTGRYVCVTVLKGWMPADLCPCTEGLADC